MFANLLPVASLMLGSYIWGEDVQKAKTQAERYFLTLTRIAAFLTLDSMDYLFRLAVEMKSLGLPWVSR